MRKRLENYIIIIPLHQHLGHPADFIDQTAHVLSEKNLVVFFDFHDPNKWKETLQELPEIMRSFLRILRAKPRGEVYFRSFAFFPYRQINWLKKINRYLSLMELKIIMSLKNMKIIHWILDPTDPTMVDFVGNLNEQISLYDCVDAIGEDPKTSRYKITENQLFNKVNLVTFNSSDLYKLKTSQNPSLAKKSMITVCGCATKVFKQIKNIVPDDLKDIKGKKIILAGVLDYRLNVDLLNYITSKNLGLNFIFIGPIRTDVRQDFHDLLRKRNVYYLGIKRKNELSYYYKNSQLGIIPYDTKYKFVRYANPMKAYEYLESSLPVVATRIKPLENYPKDIIYTTDNYQEFASAIGKLLSSWNKKKIKEARKISLKNSWENKIKLIESFILKSLED